MKKRNILVLGLFFLVLSLTVIGCGDKVPTQETLAGEQKLAIRLATDYRQGSIGYQQLENFAQTLQEKSENTIVVKVYAANEWSKAEEFAEYVKLGSLEMACLKLDNAEQLQTAYALYKQPYLFSSLQAVESYILGTEGRKALDTLPQDFYGVGFVPDGYLYLLDNGQVQWESYGVVKHLGETKALENTKIYDLRAVYSIQPLVTTRSWWDTLTEEQQSWIQESFSEAAAASFAGQRENDPTQTLLSSGVIFEDNTAPAWSSYSSMYQNQREAYFSEHSDSLTAYWRPVVIPPAITGEEAVS